LAAATVIAYMLVIMLLITPRTFLYDGAVVLGRRGFTNGPSGGNSGIGIGGRPWLQKVAAATVAISLTIATADTFAVAKSQYDRGFLDAARLQDLVENGMELKVFRVISDTFLWLAQAQTLIRLFPRQREKIIIKWTAFALISLDVLFSILNNFLFKGSNRPRSFVDAIPALSYLFQLALSLLYCAWVMYYSLTKKRFAFYHPQMKNQCLIALLSFVSILIPVVFFVLDISKPDVAGWGDYIRWVGAAAASVVVWEWVERIETLERNEKRDGVLGREVFDGDEMLEVTPSSSDSSWGIRRKSRKDDEKKGDDDRDGDDGGGGGGTTTATNGLSWPGVVGITSRYRPRASRDLESGNADQTLDRRRRKKGTRKKVPRPRPALWPSRPPVAVTPVSRTDTASAESTVYAVRYHPLSEATPPAAVNSSRSLPPPGNPEFVSSGTQDNALQSTSDNTNQQPVVGQQENVVVEAHQKKGLGTFTKVNPFRRKVQGPPAEVSAHAVRLEDATSLHGSSYRWDVRARIEDFAATQADRIRDKTKASDTTPELPVTVIPAPSRRRHYEAALEELEERDEREFSNHEYQNNELQIEPEPQITTRAHRVNELHHRWEEPHHQPTQQRSTISFAAPPSERRVTPASDGSGSRAQHSSPAAVADTDSPNHPIVSRNSPVQVRNSVSPTSTASTRRDGLTVVSIPAPPRRPRSASDSE
jgi:hypothetical protein